MEKVRTARIVGIAFRVAGCLKGPRSKGRGVGIPGVAALCLAIIAGWLATAPMTCSAAEDLRVIEFLHAMQAKDYNDLAIEYLEGLKKGKAMPPELEEIWDLEMAKCLRNHAKSSRVYTPQQAQECLDKAEKLLNTFIQQKANHPEAVAAMLSSAEFAADRAKEQILQAKLSKDKDIAAKARTEARKFVGTARERFGKAESQYKTKFEAITVPAVPKKNVSKKTKEAHQRAVVQKADAETAMLQARYQMALCDYLKAQILEGEVKNRKDPKEPKNAERIATLKGAAKMFDNIYQSGRDSNSPMSVFAHAQTGRLQEELGDLDYARDVYEEVMANCPDPRSPADPLDPLYAEVLQYWLGLLRKVRPNDYINEAERYLRDYRSRFGRMDGYFGAALELGKAYTDDKIPVPRKADRAKLSKQWIELVIKTRNPFQQEAQLFKSGEKLSVGPVAKPELAKTLDEAVLGGNSACTEKKWSDAIRWFDRAIELKGDADAKKVQEVRDVRAQCRFLIAADLFRSPKLDDMQSCLSLLRRILVEESDTKVAPEAARLGASTLLNLYQSVTDAKEKEQILTRLANTLKLAETKWPGRAETDDMRVIGGQALVVQGKLDEAIEAFDKVSPRSDRFGYALYWDGRTHWQRYVTKKNELGAKPTPEQAAKLDPDRAKAIEQLRESLAIQKKTAEAKADEKATAAAHRERQDCQLLLGEILCDFGISKVTEKTPETDKAVAAALKESVSMLQPLIDDVRQAGSSVAFDRTVIRIHLGAINAYLAMNDTKKAGETALLLAKAGPDTAQVNEILLTLLRKLDYDRRQAEAVQIKEPSNANETKLNAVRDVIGELIPELLKRKEWPFKSVMLMADTAMACGLTDIATGAYRQILENVEGANADPEMKKSLFHVRAQLIGQLRKEGKYDEAAKQIEDQLKEHKYNLPLLMEKARILQAKAEKAGTDAKSWQDAVDQWNLIRNLLQNSRGPTGKKPPEYYEVILNAAECLYAQAKNSPNKETKTAKAKEAARYLNSALILSDKLSGPEMVAKYKALLDRLRPMIGESEKKAE